MNQLSSSADVIAVVPAAGIGSRMHRLSEAVSHYRSINPARTQRGALLAHPAVKQVVVPVSPDDGWFDSLPLAQDARVLRVTGGETRAESVLAGLQTIRHSARVLVHDAARPCLHPDDLARLLAVREHSKVGAILAAPVRDTMKRAEPGKGAIAHTVERDDLWHALTPQFSRMRC